MRMDVSKLGYAQLSTISVRRASSFRLKCRAGRVTLEAETIPVDSEPVDLTGLAAHSRLVAPITFM
jgi:hypothetical protein